MWWCGVGIRRRGEWWHYVRWVPARYRHLEVGPQVRRALNTQCKATAELRARTLDQAFEARWEAGVAESDGTALERFSALHAICQARAFPYRPVAELQDGPLSDIIARVEALAPIASRTAAPPADLDEGAALLGGGKSDAPPFTKAFEGYVALTADRRVGMSPDQQRKWRNRKLKAIRSFCTVVGDLPLTEIGRREALAFRGWLLDRVEEGEIRAQSANKDIGHLSEIIRTWADVHGLETLKNPFSGMRLRDESVPETFPFSSGWIQ